VTRAANHFFIHVVHSPLGVVRHVAAPELPSQKDRAPSCGTHGSIGVYLVKEVRFEVEGHMAAPELTSARRRGPEPWDTWQRRSSPQ
jgi:hypothetical protein